MPKIDIAAVPAQQIASYPKKFAAVIAGREKQRLGDVVGLTQFGVNVTRIKPGSARSFKPLGGERSPPTGALAACAPADSSQNARRPDGRSRRGR